MYIFEPQKAAKMDTGFLKVLWFPHGRGATISKRCSYAMHLKDLKKSKPCLGHFCWHMGHRHPYHSWSHAWFFWIISHMIPYDLMWLHFISYVIIQRISYAHMIVKWYPSPWPPLRDAQHFSPPSGEAGPSWLQSEGCSLAGNWELFFQRVFSIKTCGSQCGLRPGKRTWNLKMNPWKRRFLLETIIFRFYVSFRGGIQND